jgi:hypothetical protein
MNPDAIVLAMLAVADFALIVHLRRRHGRQVQMERMMASLRIAVRRENGAEMLPMKRPLLRAG